MARTLADRLSSIARTSFVGRESEQRILLDALIEPELSFAVAYVSGPGGIGKSSFLHSIIDALPDDCAGVYLDCRDIEPTPQGFVDAIAAALRIEQHDIRAIAGALGMRRRAVIAMDSYEKFSLADAWLRQTFLPAMPENVLTVVAGREDPSPGWTTAPGWQGMFREIKLRAMTEDESREMLRSRGVSDEQAARIGRFARGYPLALELAAAALRTQPDLDVDEAAVPEVMARLTQTLVSGLAPSAVEALQAASIVRRVTEPLMAALLEAVTARGAFEELRTMSIVSQRAHGLYLHDVVRDAIASELVQRDPQLHAFYRQRACRFLSAESHRVTRGALWQYTADLLYLVQNPNVRNAFFRPGAVDVSIEDPSPEDGAVIASIARAREPADGGEWIIRWWQRHPETFKVARSGTDAVAGFYFVFERHAVDPELLRADPVTSAWCAHLDAHPVQPGERALLFRRWLSRADGEAPGVVQSASWLDIKRLYMEMRPHLRRIYCVVNDIATYAPVVTPLGFTPIDEAHVEVNGVTCYTAMLDFGEDSVDGWLRGLIGAELDSPADRAIPVAAVQTVLFTDLVGHTEMMQRLGDTRGREVLREHERITRETLRMHSGVEIKTDGDSFMVSFGSVTSAVECAVALQRAFAAWNDERAQQSAPLHVRMGLNAGEPIAEDGDLFGAAVIMASRVCAQAGSGEIFIPEPVRHLLAGKDFIFADRGEFVPKGFDDAVRLFEVRWRV